MAGWFKGNLHAHSLWSDGDDYPEMIVDWYQRRGYNFLALSDHNVLSEGHRWMRVVDANARAGHDGFGRYQERFGPRWVEARDKDGELEVRLKPLAEFRPLFEEAGQFLLIQSEEITDHFEDKPIHLNATNIQDVIEPRGGVSARDVIERNLEAVEEQSERLGVKMLTHVNHPNFYYAISAEDLAEVTRENFFEVYNGHPGTHQMGDDSHIGTEIMWDVINSFRIGRRGASPLWGLATDDSHHYFGGDVSPGRGWIMVRSEFLTPEFLIDSMERGDFYASSGVVLSDVQYAADTGLITVTIDPVEGLDYVTRFIGSYAQSGAGSPQETATGIEHAPGRPLAESVGCQLSAVEGTTARYQMTGNELYVRAVVTSSCPPENPSYPGQHAQAWTQPVGWHKWLRS